MQILTVGNETLISVLWPDRAGLLRGIVLAVVGSLVLALSAQIQIPFWPVPLTMQTLAVMLIGAAYGPLLAGATVLLYLFEGVIGLPVFAGLSGGAHVLAGAKAYSAGFLYGFVVAAVVIGWLAGRGFDRTWWRALLAFLAGDVIIFLFGWAWLASMIGPEAAFAGGVAPFLLGDALKIGLAATVTTGVWAALSRRRHED